MKRFARKKTTTTMPIGSTAHLAAEEEEDTADELAGESDSFQTKQPQPPLRIGNNNIKICGGF